jgi:ATP-dependent Clp protease ATP-binding subunit ClpX
MFELPSRKDVSKCVITKETISKGLNPTLVTSGAVAADDFEAAAGSAAS